MKTLYPYILFVTISFNLSGAIAIGQAIITGTVIDANNSDPLEFTQVALLKPSDSSLVAGAVSNTDGSFEITASSGSYLMTVNFIGYEVLWVEVEAASGQVDLGTLSLNQAAEELDEVEITAAARLFRSEVDRRVYSVENMPLAEGGF